MLTTKTTIAVYCHGQIDADQRRLRIGGLPFQRVRTAHRSVPLVHDLLTNIADGIGVCTGSKAGNGNIVDRAALGALKFIYGTSPRLIRHQAKHAPTANGCKTEYCAMSLLVGGESRVVRNQVRSAVVSYLELTIL